ncbi:MAG: ANTAR domain-containing protein [Actinomycetota bacterium]|nr:ANTAR domain-containing protein [Actinomycetota bacterium]
MGVSRSRRVAAFGLLRRLSQETNTPLVDVARQVIETDGSSPASCRSSGRGSVQRASRAY